MPEPAPEDLDRLIELQDTDTAIRRLRHRLDSLEEQRQLEASQARAAELERAADDTRVELERARAEQRQLEREIDVFTQRRDAEQARLYDGSLNSPRQISSAEAEIETTGRRIADHEELLLEVLERVETLEAQVVSFDSALEEERENVAQLTAARDETAAAILAETAELQVARDAQAAAIDPDLVARYDASVQRSGGVGVGQLTGQSCTACRVQLSMADVNDLLAGPSLTTCPQCQRMLIILD